MSPTPMLNDMSVSFSFDSLRAEKMTIETDAERISRLSEAQEDLERHLVFP